MSDAFNNEKIILHGDRLYTYLKYGYTNAPVTVSIDITNKCNNNCPHCISYLKNDTEMELSFIKTILKNLSNIGVRGIIITGGGEPLIHPDIIEILEYGNSVGLKIGMVTSGQYPKNMNIKDFLKILENLVWIRISLDAGSTERYKDTHGLPMKSFEKVIEFINIICRLKTNYKLPITIGIGYLIGIWDSDKEREDIHKAVHLVMHKGLNYFQIRPLVDRKNIDNTSYMDYPMKTKIDVETIMPTMKLYNTSVTRMLDRTYDFCHGSRFVTSITADGKLYYCCLLKNIEKGLIADLHKEHLNTVWSPRVLREVDKRINVKKCPNRCKNNVLNICIDNLKKEYTNEHKDFL